MSIPVNKGVMIAAGGTGGHVIPALAVADILKSHDIPVLWLGTRSGLEAKLVPANGYDIRWIDVTGLRGKSLVQTLTGPFRLARAITQCVRQIRVFKPGAVLGMGGFVSGPAGIAAFIMRKPLVLHEQNAVAGMTNRWLSRIATRVFSAWPGAFDTSVDAHVCGNPVRSDVEAAAKHVREMNTDSSDPLRVLVVGGSRGAAALNALVPVAVAQIDGAIDVHHQSGAGNAEDVQARYPASSGVRVRVSEFIDDMADAYHQADIVICRSGAMTVTELGAFGLPAILVPFPYAVDDHQTLNARQLADAGAALLMPQATLSAESLASTLNALSADRQQLVRMSEAARRCFVPHVADTVANTLLEVSR